MRAILGVFVTALVVAGCGGAAPSQAPAAPSAAPSAAASPSAAAPSASGGLGGVVQYKMDGAAATTSVDLVADGATLTGTAVTQFRSGTHTVKLGCGSKNGDAWAVGGTVEAATVPGEPVGAWSAVIVFDGSPQRIGIWLSDDPSVASDCTTWLKGTDFSTLPTDLFNMVESGTLVPPPGLAP